MAAYVTFFKPSGLGSTHAPTLGLMRAMEAVAAGSTSTGAAQDGEAVHVFNNETTAIYAAVGTTPVANAAASTAATSAGVVIGAGAFQVIATHTGDKVAIAAVS